MTNIFGTEAPKYWAKGLSVIPLQPYNAMDEEPRTKMPWLPKQDPDNGIPKWSLYCTEMPDKEVKQHWLEHKANGGIGLCCGILSNIVIIDIDTNDEVLIKAIEKVLPHSPWKRKGQKGYAAAYKYNGERNFSILMDSEDRGKAQILDFLSTDRQIVLPPTVHPKTRKPYEANANLYDVVDQLTYLPSDIEVVLRAALAQHVTLKTRSTAGKFNTSSFVPAGGRDNEATRAAGAFANQVLRGELSIKRALQLMEDYCDRSIQHVDGDPIDKGKFVAKVVSFIMNDIHTRGMILPTGYDEDLTIEDKERWGLRFTEDQREWTVSEINDYIFQGFAKFEGTDINANTEERMVIVTFILDKISKSPSLTELQINQILGTLKKQSKLELTTANLHKQLRAIKQGSIEGVSHQEIAVAVKKLFEERQGKLIFNNDVFMKYNGTYWQEVKDVELFRMIGENFGQLQAAKKYSDHKGIIEVLANICMFDLTTHAATGINFNNGFLNKELKLVPHSEEHGMTYMLQFSYAPDLAGKFPLFQGYLDFCWGHTPDYRQRVDCLQEMLAATIFGEATKYQKALLLYGVAGSGKSLLLDVLKQLMPPESWVNIRPDSWGDKYTTANMKGKLLNIAGELKEDMYIPGGDFKMIVSGETIQAEKKFGDIYNYNPVACHMFAGNILPKTKDGTGGFNRRWNILGFDKRVPDSVRDPYLADNIVTQEAEAIFAWAVQAVKRLRKNKGYTIVPSSEQLIEVMAMQNNGLRRWVSERLDINPKAATKTSCMILFRDYYSYAMSQNIKKATSISDFEAEFKNILSERHMIDHKYGANGLEFVGVTLKVKGK